MIGGFECIDDLALQVATDACCLLTLDLNTMTKAEAAFEVSSSSSGQSPMPLCTCWPGIYDAECMTADELRSPDDLGRLQ